MRVARSIIFLSVQLVKPQQSGATAAPASAANQALAPPASVQAGAHSLSPSSEAMRELDRGPRNSVVVHQDAAYENVHEDEDDLHVLIDRINDNDHARNELRGRGVHDLKDLHAIIEGAQVGFSWPIEVLLSKLVLHMYFDLLHPNMKLAFRASFKKNCYEQFNCFITPYLLQI